MAQSDPAPRQTRPFRNSRNQAIRIPVELELPDSEAIISRDGDRLIIEPVRKQGLAALLDSWEPLDEEFPEIDDPLAAPCDILNCAMHAGHGYRGELISNLAITLGNLRHRRPRRSLATPAMRPP